MPASSTRHIEVLLPVTAAGPTGTVAVTEEETTQAAAGFVGLAVGNAQATSVTAQGVTGITVTKPTDLIDGDVMYAFISRTTFAVNAAWTCSGWTDIGPAAASAGTTTGNDRQTTILRKVVATASGEAANYTFVNTQSTTYQIVGIIVNVHGASNTTPEDAALPAFNFNTDDATPASRNVTSITAGALVLQYIQLSLGSTTPVTPGAPSTYTLVPGGTASETAGGATDNQAITAYKVLGAAASTAGTNAWTNTPDDATTETLIACVPIRALASDVATVTGTAAVTEEETTVAASGTAYTSITGATAVTEEESTVSAAGTSTAPTVYDEDWTGTNGDPWPAEWTTSSSSGTKTVDIQNNMGRMLTTSSAFNTQRAIYADTSWDQVDGEALIEFLQFTDDATTFGITLRGSGAWSTDDSNMPTYGYKLLIDYNFQRIQFWKSVASVPTQIGTNQSFTLAYNVTYKARFRVQGTTLTATVWAASGAEPGSPTYSQTDSSIAGAGQLMLSYRSTTAAAVDGRWDNLVLTGLGGATAAVTEENDTVVAVGSVSGAGETTGTATPAEEDDPTYALAVLGAGGTVAVSEEEDTLAAQGGSVGLALVMRAVTVPVGVAAPRVRSFVLRQRFSVYAFGGAAVVEDDDGLAASGHQSVPGTAAVVEEDDTMVSAGTFTPPLVTVTGDAAVTEEDDEAGSAGTFIAPIDGTLAVTLADVTSTALGSGGNYVEPDPFPAKCTIRRQRFTRHLRYNRHAERPALDAWALNTLNQLIDFSDPGYSFTFRVGHVGVTAVLEKRTNIYGYAGSGTQHDGTPNITILWEPGELDIEPGVYDCQLTGTIANLDEVFHGVIHIVDPVG